jgi:raffinose/stachyose/melibiose transport system permease protein
MKHVFYYKSKKFLINTLIHIFLISVAITCLYPLLWMIVSSLKTQDVIFKDISLIPHQFHLENYVYAFREEGFGRSFVNSIFYTSASVLGVVIIASLAGYAFSRLRFPGRIALFYMFIAAMMVPIPASFVPLYFLLNKLHLRDTPIGYILCMISVGLSVSIFLLKTFFDRIPRELEDAARIDGCSKMGLWWHVAMPLALNVWNEYILALIIFDSRKFMPLQVALQIFQGEFVTNYPLLMAGLTIAALPIIIVYLLMQKYIIKGITKGAVFG